MWCAQSGRFHTVWGDIDLGYYCFRLQSVGVVDALWDFPSVDWTISSPGVAEPRRCPEGELSPRAGFASPSQPAISQRGWHFYNARGGIVPGDVFYLVPSLFEFRCVEEFLFREWDAMPPRWRCHRLIVDCLWILQRAQIIVNRGDDCFCRWFVEGLDLGTISDPDMRLCAPRMRWYRDVPTRSNYHKQCTKVAPLQN